MNKRTCLYKPCVLFACLAILVSTVAFAAEPVIVKGSEVSVAFGKEIASQYMIDYPGTSVDVSGGGKDNAIVMLAAGSCDIANSSLSLAEQDRREVLDALAWAEAAGHPIIEIPIAIDCVDFFVHNSNIIKSMTLEDLRDIYDGDVTSWNKFGGTGEINVYRSGADDHKLFSVKKWLTDNISSKAISVDKKLLFNAVAADPRGIGYDGVYYVGDSLSRSPDIVHSLHIIGSDDAAEYAPSRKYPVSRNLYIFIREGDTSQEARAFIDYILAPKAQKIVGKYVSPVMPPAKTFEIVLSANGVDDRVVRFDEEITNNQNLRFDNFTSGGCTLYFRNNTLVDGTYPVIENASGETRTLVNNGLFIINRRGDPSASYGLRNCNITEIAALLIEEGDVMTFAYNGHTISIQFCGSAGS